MRKDGTGRSVVAALTITLTAALMVLSGPTRSRADDDGPTPAFLALLPNGQLGATYLGNSSCQGCHATGMNGAPLFDFAAWRQSEMGDEGVRCEQCHGPGSNHAAAPSKDNILTFPNIARHEVCGQCHEDQARQFESSKHAIPVAGAIAGSNRLCLRCHSSPLRTQFIDVPFSAGWTPDQVEATISALPTTLLTGYASATHESPACANCHDPHRRTGNLTWKGEEVQLRRAVYNTDVSVVGQPGTLNKYMVMYNHTCASCHMGGTGSTASATDTALLAENARPNTHEQPQFYMLMGLGGADNGTSLRTKHATAPGQCSHCHMPEHNHAMLPDYEKSCQPCHSSSDATRRATRRMTETANSLAALKTRMQNWATAFFGNAEWWDYTALIAERGGTPPSATQEATVPIQVRRARHNYYLIVRDRSMGVHNAAYTKQLLTVASANMGSLGF